MDVALVCNECGETYRVPRFASRQCPICGARNGVPAADTSKVALSHDELDSLRTVGHGLGLVVLALSITLLFTTLGFISELIWVETLGEILIVLSGPVVGFGCPVLYGVGACLCLYVPTRSRTKGLIAAAFVCYLASMPPYAVVFVLVWIEDFLLLFDWQTPLLSVIGLAGLAGTVLFALFVARLAEFLERPEIAARALMSLYLGGAIVVLSMTIVAIADLGPNFGPQIGIVFGVLLLVVVLFALYRYVGSTWQLRAAIREIV